MERQQPFTANCNQFAKMDEDYESVVSSLRSGSCLKNVSRPPMATTAVVTTTVQKVQQQQQLQQQQQQQQQQRRVEEEPEEETFAPPKEITIRLRTSVSGVTMTTKTHDRSKQEQPICPPSPKIQQYHKQTLSRLKLRRRVTAPAVFILPSSLSTTNKNNNKKGRMEQEELEIPVSLKRIETPHTVSSEVSSVGYNNMMEESNIFSSTTNNNRSSFRWRKVVFTLKQRFSKTLEDETSNDVMSPYYATEECCYNMEEDEPPILSRHGCFA